MQAGADRQWQLATDGDRRAGPVGAGQSDPIPNTEARGRVLIVEDNWLVAIDMEATLRDAGYVVLGIAVSGAEAVELCESEPPDIVLMDIRLQGGSDGIEAAVEIRQRFDIPSIIVSAHDDPETRARAEPARPLGWIVKPIPGPELVRRLQHLKGNLK
jgi:CheY-like chemotaxis protein